MQGILIVILYVCVIYCAWYAGRWALRTYRSSPHFLKDADRQSLYAMQTSSVRRELEKRVEEVKQDEDRGGVRYRMRWQSLRPASGGERPPRELDPAIAEHVTFALTIVGDFDAAREQAGAFEDALYRPVCDLPYPKEAIRKCCEFLIRIADGEVDSPHPDRELIARERDALGVALFNLDYFVEMPAGEIPRNRQENLSFQKRRYVPGTQPPPKPRVGERILSPRSGQVERIEQVIGLDKENRWTVYDGSGTPVQIVHNAEANAWEQVEEIAPAVMPLLKFTVEQRAVDHQTPPAGTWAHPKFNAPT